MRNHAYVRRECWSRRRAARLASAGVVEMQPSPPSGTRGGLAAASELYSKRSTPIWRMRTAIRCRSSGDILVAPRSHRTKRSSCGRHASRSHPRTHRVPSRSPKCNHPLPPNAQSHRHVCAAASSWFRNNPGLIGAVFPLVVDRRAHVHYDWHVISVRGLEDLLHLATSFGLSRSTRRNSRNAVSAH